MFVGVDVVGLKSKREGEIVKQAIDDSIKSFFPDRKDGILINVEVAKEKDIGESFALVDQEEEDEFTIFISEEALEDETTLYKTICHECVHIKQYLNRELVHINQYRTMWKNKVYDHFVTPYAKRPWELEAYQVEEELFKCFADSQQ